MSSLRIKIARTVGRFIFRKTAQEKENGNYLQGRPQLWGISPQKKEKENEIKVGGPMKSGGRNIEDN